MHLYPSLFPLGVLSLIFALCPLPAVADSNSYFIVNEPTLDTQWANGNANPVKWTKGQLDGVPTVDVELARLSADGLIFVASNVPAKSFALNVLPQDVPPADDYYLLFLNSSHGIVYSVSPRFTILAAGGTANASAPASAPTVTISGGPNPTAVFATTFAALANAAHALRVVAGGAPYQLAGVAGAAAACIFGAVWTLL